MRGRERGTREREGWRVNRQKQRERERERERGREERERDKGGGGIMMDCGYVT